VPDTPDLQRPPPDPTARERVEALADRLGIAASPWRAGGAVVLAVVVGAVAWMWLRPVPAAPAPDAVLPRATTTLVGPTTTAAAPVVVQAAGAIAHPGVYTLAAGARVNDLVAAAGGLAPDADADQVLLAAVLTDGERVYVPRVGETPPPAPGGSGGTSSASSRGPVDLNTASESELESLPGIGPTLAQAIIDYRTTHGRFASVDELGDVRGIGPARLEQLRPLVKV